MIEKLDLLRTYLDKNTNILNEPNKFQIQMVEGDSVFEEAIKFLSDLPPLEELQWDEKLSKIAQEHVDDIGQNGLFLYQSSDITPQGDRISKYENYLENLGENIDYGPNDAMGVIIFLTLDDGEAERHNRKNLFKQDYQKIGIACGSHKTEFKMCVMDFADEFISLKLDMEESNDKFKKIEEELKMKIEELNKENNNLKNNEAKLKEIIEDKGKKVEELNKENNNLKNNEGKLKKVIETKEKEVEELNKENNNLKNNEEKLKKVIESKEKEVEKLNKKNNNIQKELNDMKKTKEEIELKYKQMQDDYNVKNNKLIESNNEINKLKEDLNKLKKITETQNKEIEKLNSINKEFNDKMKDFNKFQNLIVQKDIEINELKQKLNQYNNFMNRNIENKEKATNDKCVCFFAPNKSITYAIPCSGESTFAEVEEKFYQEYSEYRMTNNTFLANGKDILRFQTINYNNIGNGKPILLIVPS